MDDIAGTRRPGAGAPRAAKVGERVPACFAEGSNGAPSYLGPLGLLASLPLLDPEAAMKGALPRSKDTKEVRVAPEEQIREHDV